MTVLVSVWGAAPGVGKSTVCAGLARSLAGAGLRVDHFHEEEILTRPQFAAVAEEFRATGAVGLNTLITATARFVESVQARGDDVVIADALVPFMPTLLAMGHGEQTIDTFTADLTRVLSPLRPVIVFLDGDPAIALSRAALREGAGWLDQYVTKLTAYGVIPRVTDLASAVTYLRRERAMTLDVAGRPGWGLVMVERADELPREEVLGVAARGLGAWLGGGDGEALLRAVEGERRERPA
ncbi:hypothetical protein [Streptomyces sp. NPDC051576]|uniref:hypothetical protein n=1 Tax=Streptomyces sp. NPDC051576 TaxID=3155803 RepID=UPI0034148306